MYTPPLVAFVGAVDVNEAERALALLPEILRYLPNDFQSWTGGRIDAVASEYDFILLDCPPALGLLNTNALSAAHDVLVPVSTDIMSIEVLPKFEETIHEVQREINPRLTTSYVGYLRACYSNLASRIIESGDWSKRLTWKSDKVVFQADGSHN